MLQLVQAQLNASSPFSTRVPMTDVGVDSPKVTVSGRLGAYWLYLGCSTTERVLNSLCVIRGAHSLSFAFSFPTLAGVGQPIIHDLNIQGIRL